MVSIANDKELRSALDSLTVARQRQVAGRFVEGLLYLIDDNRVVRAVEVAKDGEATESELEEASQGAKSASVESYTRCGKDTEWRSQAGHFVAAAGAVSAAPAANLPVVGNPAWKAAMYARMARTCEMIAADKGELSSEADHQYRIIAEFLSS